MSAAKSPAAQPKAKKRERRTLDDVVRVAAELIAEKGYKDTSLSDIAAALGIRKSTVYHHVSSKDRLLFLIFLDYQQYGKDIIATAESEGPSARARLKAVIREHLATIASHPVGAVVAAQELRNLEGDYRREALAIRDTYDNYVADLIRDGQRTGEFKKSIDARLAGLAITSMINGTHVWYRPTGSKAAGDIAGLYSELLLTGLDT